VSGTPTGAVLHDRVQHRADPRQDGGDRPHDGPDAPDRDAEQPRPLGRVRRSADRGSERGPLEAPPESKHDDRNGDHHRRLLTAELHPADGGWTRDGEAEGGDRTEVAGEVGAETVRHRQDLQQSDRGDRQHQAGRGLEPLDHRRVDGGAHSGGGHEPEADRHPDLHVPAGHGHLDQRRGDAAEGGLGDVDHPGRPVDEDQAHGGERDQGTLDRPLDRHADGDRPVREPPGHEPGYEGSGGDRDRAGRQPERARHHDPAGPLRLHPAGARHGTLRVTGRPTGS
jgi:hypothetical protein